jgi:hypothetical protein
MGGASPLRGLAPPKWYKGPVCPLSFTLLMPFAIKKLLNGGRFWRRPPRRGGRRLSMGPPPAEGGRRPHKIPQTRILV